MGHLCVRWSQRPCPVRIRFSHSLRVRLRPAMDIFNRIPVNLEVAFPLFLTRGGLLAHSGLYRCHSFWERVSQVLAFRLRICGLVEVALRAIFSTALCLLMRGESIFAKTESLCVGVKSTVPEIIRVVFLSSTSTRLKWWLPSHIGTRYSAAENTKTDDPRTFTTQVIPANLDVKDERVTRLNQ